MLVVQWICKGRLCKWHSGYVRVDCVNGKMDM